MVPPPGSTSEDVSRGPVLPPALSLLTPTPTPTAAEPPAPVFPRPASAFITSATAASAETASAPAEGVRKAPNVAVERRRRSSSDRPYLRSGSRGAWGEYGGGGRGRGHCWGIRSSVDRERKEKRGEIRARRGERRERREGAPRPGCEPDALLRSSNHSRLRQVFAT
jgi:hypothetical protein